MEEFETFCFEVLVVSVKPLFESRLELVINGYYKF